MASRSISNSDFDPEEEVKSLSSIFKDGLDLYNNLGKSDEPTNSPSVQANIKRAMKIFEKATRLVSFANIFSTNENVSEISTNDLQYFLLPALLGSLALKLTSGDRKEIVDVAEIYFKDFLKRCNDYGLSNYQFSDKQESNGPEPKSEFEQIAVAVNTRANKIQRYREQKELKANLENLKKNMENEHADEEIKRNYVLTMIKVFIYEAIDELNSIDMEKPILDHMAKMKKDDKSESKRPPPPPLKPIIITKDEVQKAIFGAGYPSIPTMSVQEFYDKRVKEGIFPDPNKKQTGPLSLQQAALAGISLTDKDDEDATKEKKTEEDDPETLERMRRMDEFKDEHRKGYGNRMDRS